MRIAILSDLHANPFALRAVLADVARWGAEAILCAGDFFGYYPWAQETFDLLQGLGMRGVLGNHDRLVLESLAERTDPDAAVARSVYYPAAAQNGRALAPAAREWLSALPLRREESLEGWRIQMCHGTPANCLEGRYYPDTLSRPEWLPRAREILILGHTHHPFSRWVKDGGLLLNPGSVGQPRDGDPRPSWMAVDTDRLEAGGRRPRLLRVPYDRQEPMALLRTMGWPARSIRALDKVRPGPLDAPDLG